MGEQAVRARLEQVLGTSAEDIAVTFTERVIGNESPTETPLVTAITRWVARTDPGAQTVPVILQGFSDSAWFRAAFPDCAAYGFFPMRHQGLLQASSLMHSADERIDVRDLGLATACYRELIAEQLG